LLQLNIWAGIALPQLSTIGAVVPPQMRVTASWPVVTPLSATGSEKGKHCEKVGATVGTCAVIVTLTPVATTAVAVGINGGQLKLLILKSSLLIWFYFLVY